MYFVCCLPVLSSRMTMLFQARLWSGFSTVAFLQAFRASTCLFWSAYCQAKREKILGIARLKYYQCKINHSTKGFFFHFLFKEKS